MCFPVYIAKFLRPPFLAEQLRYFWVFCKNISVFFHYVDRDISTMSSLSNAQFFLTSSKTSFKLTQEKWKCDPLLLLRLGQEILTVYGSTSWNSGILRSFTELVKSDFKIFIVFLFTYQSNFIIWFYFIWWHGFNSFPKLPII